MAELKEKLLQMDFLMGQEQDRWKQKGRKVEIKQVKQLGKQIEGFKLKKMRISFSHLIFAWRVLQHILTIKSFKTTESLKLWKE